MTKDEIIDMARKAGARQMVSFMTLTHPNGPVTALKFDLDSDSIEAFAKLVAEKAIKEALAQTQEPKIKTIDPFESSRVADYNRGWNDCLFASGIVKQTEQEPEWYHGIDVYGCNRFYHKTEDRTSEFNTPLYTTPLQRKPLSDEEIAVERALDNLLYWTERAVNKGNANSDIEEAMQQYNDALAAAHGIKGD